MQVDNQETAKAEPRFSPVFSFPPWINLSGPLGGLKFQSWPKLDDEMDKLIKKELAELVSKLQSINGVFTEDSYRERCDELFSQNVRDGRAATLEKAAQEVMRGLGGGMRKPSATIKGCKIAVCPVRAKLLVWIDVEICQHKLENWRTKGKSVSEGTFTGEQEYSVERQAIETTERNRDDGDQPMEPNDHRSGGFSNGTDVTHGTNGPGSDLFSQQTKQSSNDDGTSVSAQIIEKENQSVSIFG